MIRQIKLIRNIGQFSSVETGQEIGLDRLVLVHSENGRGKTTLSAIFRSLANGNPASIIERHRLGSQHPPHVILDCDGYPQVVFQNGDWNHSLSNLAVFDDVFVDENIYSGLDVNAQNRQNLHELVLGNEGVSLSRRLQELISQIEQHNSNLRDWSNAIPTSERQGLSVDEFCDLAPIDDIESKIELTQREISAVQNQTSIRNTPIFEPIGLPAFDIDNINQVLGTDLPELDAASESKVHAHFAEIGADGEQWINNGMQRIVAVQDQQICPFCAQDLANSSLLTHYRAYFNESYGDLKRTITSLADDVRHQHSGTTQATFERTVRNAVEKRQFWEQYCEVPDISFDTEAIVRDWNTATERVLKTLSSKRSAPLERMNLGDNEIDILSTYEQHRMSIVDLSDSLIETNSAITTLKERTDAANLEMVRNSLNKLKATKARYTPEIDALCKVYLEEKTAKARTEAQRNATRTELRNYQTEVFPSMQYAVNTYLNRFSAGFQLENVASTGTRGGSACTYDVLINGTAVAITGSSSGQPEPSFRNTLSSGDRNTLALAFFFASLEQDPDLRNKIVVIDDPITSLDDHRAVTTAQRIRYLSEQVAQLFVLSHDQRFLVEIWRGLNSQNRRNVALKIIRDTAGSTLSTWEVSEDAITEHDQRDSKLRDYVNNNDGELIDVARSIRPHLESFLRVAYPQHFRPGAMLGPFLNTCRQKLDHPDEILKGTDIQELSELHEYASTFHHEANSTTEVASINDAELRGFVTRALDFVKR